MHEAVTMLKGVMGFTDQPLTSPPKLRRIRTIPPSYSETRLRRPIASFTTQSRSSSASPRKGPNRPTEEVLLALGPIQTSLPPFALSRCHFDLGTSSLCRLAREP